MTPKSILRYFTGGVRVQVEAHLALMHSLKRRNKPWLAKLVANRMQRRFLIFVSHRADLHPGVEFRHPTGIVIGDGVKVGKGSVIYQNVTLGGARSGDAALNAYPQVGENRDHFCRGRSGRQYLDRRQLHHRCECRRDKRHSRECHCGRCPGQDRSQNVKTV